MGNQLTSVYEEDDNADEIIDYRQEIIYKYLDGCKSVIGISSEETEVAFNSPLDTMNEELILFEPLAEI